MQRLRESQSLGVNELADRAKVSPSVITRLETSGKAFNPTWKTLEAIARGLGLTIDTFILNICEKP